MKKTTVKGRSITREFKCPYCRCSFISDEYGIRANTVRFEPDHKIVVSSFELADTCPNCGCLLETEVEEGL